MQTKIYEVGDEDLLIEFFGPDAPDRPIATFPQDHGLLIFEGPLSLHPDVGDALLLDGEGESVVEYVIVARLYHADSNSATLVVHEREFVSNKEMS